MKDEQSQEIARRDKEALDYIMQDPKGRWFMARLMDKTHINITTFTGDQLTTAYNEGKRSIGLTYLRELTKNVDNIGKKQEMEKEYAETMELISRMGEKKDGKRLV